MIAHMRQSGHSSSPLTRPAAALGTTTVWVTQLPLAIPNPLEHAQQREQLWSCVRQDSPIRATATHAFKDSGSGETQIFRAYDVSPRATS
jgi:hypothetical protein